MTHQQDIVDRARAVLPGAGFGNFDANFVIREGQGAHIWDEDGNEYIDFLIGSGPMILGHCHPEVVEAVQEQVAKGSTFFTSNAHGIELAEEICRAVACAEQIRFASTGTEADMFAMRLARAHTGRDKILKFEGGYHGMSAEGQMSLAPDRLMNFPVAIPDSAGIPDGVRDDMLVAPYNDIEFFRSLMAERGHEIAGVIVEPLQRIIPPLPGFLEAIREECTRHVVVMIFDEVVTGFRLAYGGAQEVYGVTPDVCTLGKIIGGGYPLAVIAGKAEVMAHFDAAKVGKDKALMQIGTLSGNPVAAVAGLKTMEILRRPGQYDHLYAIGERLISAVNEHLGAAGHAHHVSGHSVLFDIVFADGPIHNYRDVQRGDAAKMARFNAVLREQGIFKGPSKFYPCLALTDDDVDRTVEAIALAAKSLHD